MIRCGKNQKLDLWLYDVFVQKKKLSSHKKANTIYRTFVERKPFLVNHFAACEPPGATVHTFLRYWTLRYSGYLYIVFHYLR